jgi:hypothetical protein
MIGEHYSDLAKPERAGKLMSEAAVKPLKPLVWCDIDMFNFGVISVKVCPAAAMRK